VRVYLDTCVVIYRVEEPPEFLPLVQVAIARYPSGVFCVSPLVYLECLVGALRSPQVDLVARYEAFLHACVCLEMPMAVYRLAADLRAEYGLKTPDALHLATARHHACDVFLTNDDRLGRVAGEMLVNALGEIGP
jgi:uncharacterized protein